MTDTVRAMTFNTPCLLTRIPDHVIPSRLAFHRLLFRRCILLCEGLRPHGSRQWMLHISVLRCDTAMRSRTVPPHYMTRLDIHVISETLRVPEAFRYKDSIDTECV